MQSIMSFFLGAFQGFVISDWQGIDRITSPPHLNYSYSVEVGVGAGIDMVCQHFEHVYCKLYIHHRTK